MALYNNGNPFVGGSVMAIDLPEGKYVTRLTNGNGRFGEPKDKELLRFTNPRYTYKHVEIAIVEEVVPPVPVNPTIEQWIENDRYEAGACSLRKNNHGGNCCGIHNIHRFSTSAAGENTNSAPTRGNALRLKDWCDATQEANDDDNGGPSIFEVCLTEDQLGQRNEYGWNWRDILEGYFGFREVYNFRNCNTDGRRVYVFIKDFGYEG